jgi:hypothetical protein
MSDKERAARYSDLFEPGGGHQHPSNCAYCPICAAIGVVRNTQPEIINHLAVAARELLIAAGLFLEEAERLVASEDPPRSEPGVSPIHID